MSRGGDGSEELFVDFDALGEVLNRLGRSAEQLLELDRRMAGASGRGGIADVTAAEAVEEFGHAWRNARAHVLTNLTSCQDYVQGAIATYRAAESSVAAAVGGRR
jgi:hypothetical protein